MAVVPVPVCQCLTVVSVPGRLLLQQLLTNASALLKSPNISAELGVSPASPKLGSGPASDGWGNSTNDTVQRTAPNGSKGDASEPVGFGAPPVTDVPADEAEEAAPDGAATVKGWDWGLSEEKETGEENKQTPAAPSRKPPVNDSVRSRLEAGFRITNVEQCPSGGVNLQLVIVITTAPGHERQRKAIRLTWGGAVAQRRDVALVFYLGRTTEALQRTVDDEQATYGDIVQGNFVDSYDNLTLKSASMLEWLSTYCPKARMILKTDDDIFINTDNLLKFIKVHSSDTNKLFGRLAHGWKPIRNGKSKYYLSHESFKGDYLPDFVTGPAYVMTGDLVEPLYHATLNARFIRLEDVLVTGVLADKLNITRVSAKEFMNYRIVEDTCRFATAVSVHNIKFEEQFDIWQSIQDGQTSCPSPYEPTGG